MAWQTPKIDWGAQDGVRDTDINRIEGNILELYNTDAARNDTTLYVSAAGDDTGNGTSDRPFSTITRAINALPKNLNGKTITINIAGGTYSEDVLIANFSNGTIAITGTYNATVVTNNFTINNSVCSINNIGLTTRKISITNGGMLSSFVTITSTSQGLNVDNCSRAHIFEFIMNVSSPYGVYVVNNASVYISNLVLGLQVNRGIYVVGGSIMSYGTISNLSPTPITTASGGRVYTGQQSGGVSLADAEVI